MKLNEYAAAKRIAAFERLQQGLPPDEGEFDESIWREAKVKGRPQMGATRYEPISIFIEFIYADPNGAAIVLTVRYDAPERIVHMTVPEWVIESIWQGEVSGSYHFESDAKKLLAEFEESLSPAKNSALFGPRQPVGRA